MPQIERRLLSAWPELGIGGKPRRLQWAVINGGISIRSKLVCPFWRDGSTMPFAIAKYPRYAQYNGRVTTEYNALSELQHYLPAWGGAPRPMLTFRVGELEVTVESAISGRPVRAYLREQPQRHSEELERLGGFVTWMCEMHSRSARRVDGPERNRSLWEPFEGARRELELSTREAGALDQLEQLALELSSAEQIPTVFNHNDPGSTNVMVNGKGEFVGLIDWESGAHGLPGFDLFYFLARFAFETRAFGTSDQLRGFREMFFDSTNHRAQRGMSWMAKYAQTIDISEDWLPVLFGLCWVMHARNEREYLLGLRSEGQLLHGKPAAVQTARADAEAIAEGHFRSQLRFYLENKSRFVCSGSSLRAVG